MSTSPGDNWQTLDTGAGGWITGIDIAPDDTMVIRTDTYGAYIWNGTEWQQLVTATSMPASAVSSGVLAQGVYEIQIAPSDSNILYMMDGGDVFHSTDKGATWTQTNFAQVTEVTNDPYRMNGQKMAVDPNNPNVVYVGTQQNGLFVTTDGGVTWKSVSSVPVSLTDANGVYPGITGIEFDPALGVSGGITNTIFASSYGNGVFESTNGGATWARLAGGPTDVESAAVSASGAYYAIGDNNTELWKYANGTWTELLTNTTAELHSVTVDPFNPNHIVVATPSGSLNQSFNGGTTWSGQNWNTQLTSTDIPWLATTSSWMSIGGIAFDQLVPNKLWAADGVGVWNTSVPTQLLGTTPVVWDSQSLGIEQLVANEILVPPGGNPILASWDRAFIDVTDPNAFPSTYGPVDGKFAAGWSLDYASSNPSFIVGIADWWGTEESGYSINGGQTWNLFPTMPSFAGKTIGGSIAASSPTDIVWAPADGYDPVYTTNGGLTWNPVVLPGVTSYTGFDSAYYYDARTVTADRVLPNTFYLYDAGQGVYRSTDGGITWTQVFSGQISPFSNFSAELESVPGEAGNLFFTGGPQTNLPNEKFYQSTNGGATWVAIPNVQEVETFGFGAPATPGGYPSIYIVGWVNGVYGIWQSNDDAKSWVQIGDYPDGTLDRIKTISGDPNTYGQVYVGFNGAGYAYLPAAPVVPAAPTIASVSLDSGTAGNGVTNATVLMLSGTAEANSAVKIYDGSILLGSATANASGTWSFVTAKLANGAHFFTTTTTDSTGHTSAASSALTVTVDTVAPAAPTNWTSADILYASNGKSMSEIWLNGTTLYQSESWNADGSVHDIHSYTAGTFQGVVYASYDNAYNAGFRDLETFYDANGNAIATESFQSNGGYAITVGSTLTQQKTVNPDGSYDIHYYAITGQSYTAYDVVHAANGKLTSEIWLNGTTLYQSESWNADGSVHDIHSYTAGTFQGVVYASYDNAYNAGFRDLETFYDANGNAVATESFQSNGGYAITLGSTLTQQKTINSDGSYDIDFYGVTGKPYTGYDVVYGANSKPASEIWLNGTALYQSESWNADGSVHDIHSYTAGTFQGVVYASSDNAYNAGFRDLETFYDANGNVVATESFQSNGGYAITLGSTLTQQKTVNPDGSYDIHYYAITGQSYTAYDVVYAANGKLTSESWSNGPSEIWTYNSNGGLLVDTTTPTALADHSYLMLGGALTVSASTGVLANDHDADPNDTLSVSTVDSQSSAVGHAVTGEFGTLTLNTNGSYVYHNTDTTDVTAAGGVAEDNFTYTVSNGHGGVASSTLSVVITSPGETYVGAAAGSTVTGGTGSYVLDGSAGDVTATAGSGNQFLFGGSGDTLNAGSGSDTFIFSANFGNNTVNNFNTSLDIIELPKSEFASTAAALADAHQVGANVVITYDALDTITLTHIALQNLHATNFHLV